MMTLVQRWYQFGAPWEGMAVDVAGARPSMPQGNPRYFPEATGRPPGEELSQTSPEAVAALQRQGGETPATWSVGRWRGPDSEVEDEAAMGGNRARERGQQTTSVSEPLVSHP